MKNNNVKLILGSHGSGKSDCLYNHFLFNSRKSDGKSIDLKKKLFLVVPEQDTNAKQRIMIRKAKEKGFGAGILNIDVVSFDRIAHNVFSILNIEPLKENVVEDDAKTMILSLVLSRLSKEDKIIYYKKLVKKIGFAKKLTQVVSEFYSYNITSEDIKKVIDNSHVDWFKAKLHDLDLIYTSFKDELKKKGFSIKEDKYNLLSENVLKVDMFNDAIVAFDGFTGFTPVQLDIFKKIATVAKEVFVTIDIRDTNDLIGKTPKMTDVFYLSEKFVNDIATSLSSVGIELPFENYIDLNKKEVTNKNNSVIKYKDKEDFARLEREIYNVKASTAKEKNSKAQSENIKLYVSKNIKEEVAFTISVIMDFIKNRGMRFNDIRIIVPEVLDYNDIILKECGKNNIPVFIDDSTGIYNSPYIETIRAALDVVAYDFSYDSVMRYLNSGIIEKDEEINRIDNYIRKNGTRGYKKYEEFETSHGDVISPLISLYKSIRLNNEILVKNDTMCAFDIYIDAIEKFIKDINLEGRFKEFIEALDENSYDYKRQFKVLSSSIEVAKKTFANLRIINKGDENKYNIDDFKKALDVGFESVEVKSIPFSLDQVIVGDFMRSRFDNPKVLIVLGLNQSRIPGKLIDVSLIDDRMRMDFTANDITLSQTTFETALNQRFYTYLALTNQTDKLILSYTKQNADGEGDEKSSIVNEVLRLFDLKEEKVNVDELEFYSIENIIDYIASNLDLVKKYLSKNGKLLPLENKKAEKAISLIKYLKNSSDNKAKNFILYFDRALNQKEYLVDRNINEELMQELTYTRDSDDFICSATSLESYNKCPYQYFLNHVINLKEREYFEINSLDLGNFYHSVLQVIFDDESFNISDEKSFDLALNKAIEKVSKSNVKFSMFGVDDNPEIGANKIRYIRERAKATIMSSLKVLKLLSDGSSLKSYDTEKEFTYEIVEKGLLKGRIDNIEKLSVDDKTYINIIDYKSGSKKISIEDIENGIDIQLILYLDYCINSKVLEKGKTVVPCGAFYFTLQNPIVKVSDYSEVADIDKKINELMQFVGIGSTNIEDMKVLNKNLKAVYDKSGVITSYEQSDKGLMITGKMMDSEMLENEREVVKKKIMESIASIKKGVVSKKPYDNKNCKYCSYKNICRKEISIENDVENDEEDVEDEV